MVRSRQDQVDPPISPIRLRLCISLCFGLIALGVFGLVHLVDAWFVLPGEDSGASNLSVEFQLALLQVPTGIWLISTIDSIGLILGLLLWRSYRLSTASSLALVIPWLAAGLGSLATMVLYPRDRSGGTTSPIHPGWNIRIFLLNNPTRQCLWGLGVFLLGLLLGWTITGVKSSSRATSDPRRQRLLGIFLTGIGGLIVIVGLRPDTLIAIIIPPRRYHYYYFDSTATLGLDIATCLGLVTAIAGICLFRLPSLRARLRD